jgi:hypothetical protein
MANARGFWSYVHADDTADHDRIATLARDVVEQFQMVTGESIELFLDQDDLEWGDPWRPKVDGAWHRSRFSSLLLRHGTFAAPNAEESFNSSLARLKP